MFRNCRFFPSIISHSLHSHTLTNDTNLVFNDSRVVCVCVFFCTQISLFCKYYVFLIQKKIVLGNFSMQKTLSVICAHFFKTNIFYVRDDLVM